MVKYIGSQDENRLTSSGSSSHRAQCYHKASVVVGIDRQVQLLEGPSLVIFCAVPIKLNVSCHPRCRIQTFLSQQKGKYGPEFRFYLSAWYNKIILSFIYFGLSMALAFVLGLLYKPDWMTKLLVIQILHSAILFCGLFAAELRYSLDRLFSILDKALSLGIMGVALLIIRDVSAIDTMLNAQLIGLELALCSRYPFCILVNDCLTRAARAYPSRIISFFSVPYPLP